MLQHPAIILSHASFMVSSLYIIFVLVCHTYIFSPTLLNLNVFGLLRPPAEKELRERLEGKILRAFPSLIVLDFGFFIFHEQIIRLCYYSKQILHFLKVLFVGK